MIECFIVVYQPYVWLKTRIICHPNKIKINEDCLVKKFSEYYTT